MKLPADRLIIARRKLTDYLLVHRQKNDKSIFLLACGFTLNEADALKAALIHQATTCEILEIYRNDFGLVHEVQGNLTALKGRDMLIVTVWILRDEGEGLYEFVTLVPGGK
ncbi:MAG: hypothetical protein OXB89_07495 [Anaerolineaceae bacterium]|nr:hypothetical protein [Anaerolineaceae bacterium]